ncbi:tetratricopeptide repeat protein [Patescibacteria group bacterium]|nr:tetratricopeptide repeat protein [Patescibacteria group bacterium]
MILAQAIRKHRFSLLFLLALVLIVYGNSLNNSFLSDDLAEIVQNPNIGNFNDIFSHGIGYIRPFLYWVVFQIGEFNPALFRSINIFFHLGSVFLVYTLFNLLYSKRLSFLVACLFAVHPAISETVVWISGGMYTQYGFFFLLSFVLYLSSRERISLYWLSVTAYFLSFMSHPQMPLALFLIFPLFEGTFGNLKKNWFKMLPYFLVALVFLLITLSALPERQTALQTTHYQQGGMDNPLITVPVSITSYFELTLFPKTLTLYHSELSFGKTEFAGRFLITLAFFATLAISYRKNKFIFFWLSFFLITLLPTLNPFRLNWLVAERYLYIPIIGILAIVGLGFDKLISSAKLRQTGYILFAITIILFSLRTVVRNTDWKNQDNLWIATGKTSPSSPNTHNNLGDVYGRQGDKLAALQEFQKAIELKPDYGDAYHNLANTYGELGQLDKALENYQNALKFNPNLWQSYQNTAAVYFEQKKYDLALLNFQKAVQMNPGNLPLQNAIGIVYLSMGDKDKARDIFQQLLNIDPNNQTLKQELLETNK